MNISNVKFLWPNLSQEKLLKIVETLLIIIADGMPSLHESRRQEEELLIAAWMLMRIRLQLKRLIYWPCPCRVIIVLAIKATKLYCYLDNHNPSLSYLQCTHEALLWRKCTEQYCMSHNNYYYCKLLTRIPARHYCMPYKLILRQA